MKQPSDGMPIVGGRRRRRNRAPTIKSSGLETSMLKYSALGATLTTDANGNSGGFRPYVGGNYLGTFTATPTGVVIASSYNEFRFLPGTRARWEPSVGFTSSGRIYVAFCDNPEVNYQIYQAYQTYQGAPTGLNYNLYANNVKAMGSLLSFPVYKETDVQLPDKIRRREFDINVNISMTDVNAINRSVQTIMWIAIDGCAANSGVGSFLYHDNLMVSGMSATSLT